MQIIRDNLHITLAHSVRHFQQGEERLFIFFFLRLRELISLSNRFLFLDINCRLCVVFGSFDQFLIHNLFDFFNGRRDSFGGWLRLRFGNSWDFLSLNRSIWDVGGTTFIANFFFVLLLEISPLFFFFDNFCSELVKKVSLSDMGIISIL